MQSHSISRPVAGVIAIVLTFLLTSGAAADSARERERNPGPKPTVVLVHGAFADASSWNAVVDGLRDRGFSVIAPADPLRGVQSDSAYAASLLDTLTGPLILIGHSYGGIIISNAAAITHNAQNVKALVFVAAFIPDVGEAAQDLSPLPGSLISPSTLQLRTCPVASCAAGAEACIDPLHFREIMAGDQPLEKTQLLAATQRPVSLTGFSDRSEFAAWHTVPSFSIVPTEDHAIGAANERVMAQRAHAQTIEVKASHLVMLSHPEAVVRLIESAAAGH